MNAEGSGAEVASIAWIALSEQPSIHSHAAARPGIATFAIVNIGILVETPSHALLVVLVLQPLQLTLGIRNCQ